MLTEVKVHEFGTPKGRQPDGRIVITEAIAEREIESIGVAKDGFKVFIWQKGLNQLVFGKILPLLTITEDDQPKFGKMVSEQLPQVMTNTDYELLEIDFESSKVSYVKNPNGAVHLIFKDDGAMLGFFQRVLPHTSLMRRNTEERLQLSQMLLELGGIDTPQNLEVVSSFYGRMDPQSTRIQTRFSLVS